MKHRVKFETEDSKICLSGKTPSHPLIGSSRIERRPQKNYRKKKRFLPACVAGVPVRTTSHFRIPFFAVAPIFARPDFARTQFSTGKPCTQAGFTY